MDILINIVIAFVCGLVPTLLTLWLNERVKGSVKNSFDEKLERLKKEHSKEISQFQTELTHLKSRENFKFTKLHEKRLEVLEKTYQLCSENLVFLKRYLKPIKGLQEGITEFENEKELRDNFRSGHNKLHIYFNSHSLYFSDDLDKLLQSFFIESAKIFRIYDRKYQIVIKGETPDDDVLKNSKIAYTKIPEILTPIQKEIKDKFRELLGQ